MTRTVETERSTSDVSGGITLTICSQYIKFEGNRTVVPGAIVLTLVISCPAAPAAPRAPSNKYFIVKAQLTLAISVNGLFLGMYAVKDFFYNWGTKVAARRTRIDLELSGLIGCRPKYRNGKSHVRQRRKNREQRRRRRIRRELWNLCNRTKS